MMITVDLFDILQVVWQTLSSDYDVTADLPDIDLLFNDVDPSDPRQAAEGIVVNLLSEAMEYVGRFSPWYRRPARAFGVVLEHDEMNCARWVLSDEGRRARAPLINMLQHAVERNMSVILATRFLDDLDPHDGREEACRSASCQCYPPRTILIHRSVFGRVEIICDTCHQPFT